MRFDSGLPRPTASIRLDTGLETGNVVNRIISIAKQTDLLGRFDGIVIGSHGRLGGIFVGGFGRLDDVVAAVLLALSVAGHGRRSSRPAAARGAFGAAAGLRMGRLRAAMARLRLDIAGPSVAIAPISRTSRNSSPADAPWLPGGNRTVRRRDTITGRPMPPIDARVGGLKPNDLRPWLGLGRGRFFGLTGIAGGTSDKTEVALRVAGIGRRIGPPRSARLGLLRPAGLARAGRRITPVPVSRATARKLGAAHAAPGSTSAIVDLPEMLLTG